jgi:cytochrome P450
MQSASLDLAPAPRPVRSDSVRSAVRDSSLPPGTGLPPIIQMCLYAMRPTAFIEWNARRFGDTFTLRNSFFGNQVCVSRPEAIKEVFTADPDTMRAGEANVFARPIVGDGSVLLQDGPSHLRKRRLILPPFHGERMNAYTKVMVEETERAIAPWRRGQTVALRPISQQITLSVILRAVFGADDGEEQSALSLALREWQNLGSKPLSGLLLMTPRLQRDLGPSSPWGALVRARAKADALIYALIARRRREETTGRSDILSLLLAAKDEQGNPMADTELRDELITLLVAGHETTAATLCWLFEELLSRPDVLAEVQREVTTADVSKLPILDAAIKEVLRLRPILPAVGRLLTEPTRIAGYDLPAKTMVAPVAYLTHRLPDLYPSPLEFRLERFLGRKIDPYAWLPFGGGVRRCIGMAFALQELRVITATMLVRHGLRLVRGRPSRPAFRGGTVSPAGDTPLLVA